jgi:hypothetical protein
MTIDAVAPKDCPNPPRGPVAVGAALMRMRKAATKSQVNSKGESDWAVSSLRPDHSLLECQGLFHLRVLRCTVFIATASHLRSGERVRSGGENTVHACEGLMNKQVRQYE